uniref:NADH-ubiquinone oxidoreductase chain 4 n=1 Tax=Gongylonema pulchrum TaxID=637853 RepID=A0A0D3MTI9_9BILA|nr:NADH dehydrogenase subunit 4 [Gongylonema pulchrum]AIY56395.1 NADH dehydrogenase subunit 4 [Gongylonema pulchrum]
MFVSFFDFFYFFLFFFFLLIFGIVDFSWSGCVFFFDSLNFLFLSFMSVLVLGYIGFSESSFSLIFYSYLVIFFSVLFFFSNNMIFLYVFYELTMIPILFCLLGFGRQVEKIGACYYLIFYTLFFGLPYLFFYSHLIFFFNFVYYDFFMTYESMLFLSFCFLVKFPVYFFHLWLPKAHVEAPTSTSMVLAGVMLKLGGVGMYRMMMGSGFFGLEVWLFLSFFSMVFCSFICMLQSDSKSLAAYSSICHMGFVLLSEMCMVYYGKSMALVMMLAHGYTSVLMFYFIGEFFHVSGSRLIYYFRGFFNCNLLFSLFFCLVMMSNFSFPSAISFFSEYVMLNFFSSICFFGFIFLFFYYMISFFYSVYIMVCFLLGKGGVEVFEGRFVFCLPLIFMMYNFFWFGFVI